MKPEQKQQLKRQIETALAEADTTLRHLEEASQAVAPDNALGRLTRMETMSDQQMSKAKLAKMREHQAALREALRRLPAPGFGVCNVCREPIPTERLLAVPEAQVCVPCLRKLQAGKRR